MNTRQSTRNMRIGRLKALLLATKEQNKTAEYNKLVAYCMEEFEIARRTAREYVDQLKLGGFCDKNNIYIEDNIPNIKEALKPIK